MSSPRRVIGYMIALVGGCLGLLAFFTMPLISAGFLSLSAQQFASLASQYLQQSSPYTGDSGSGLLLYWLAPILGSLIALIAAFQFRASALMSQRKTAGGWIIALALAGLLLYTGEMIYIASGINAGSSSSLNFSYLGSGFWAYIIAMIGAIVGALIAMAAGGQITQYTQYQSPPQNPPAPGVGDGQQWPPNQ